LGGKLLGWRTVCAVELDAHCRRILLARQRDGFLPKFPIWDNVETFDGKPWRGHADVVTGGFPCQDVSVGNPYGQGLEGTRSGLWREMARIIGEVRPLHAFVENSPAIVHRGLGRVLGDLAELGYHARWGVLGAGHFGAWHLRERFWLVATDSLRQRGQGRGIEQVSGGRRFPWIEDIRSIEDLQKLSSIPQPLLRRNNDGLSAGLDQRLKAIGNSQVPAVVREAWHALSR
jgi:DNA (cytosine-5)-methyltransferase 1